MTGPLTPGVSDEDDPRVCREAGRRFLESIGHAIDHDGPSSSVTASPYAPIMIKQWGQGDGPDDTRTPVSVDVRGRNDDVVWERTPSGGMRTFGSLFGVEATNRAGGWEITNQGNGWKVTNPVDSWKVTNPSSDRLESNTHARAHANARPRTGWPYAGAPVMYRFYQALIYGFMRLIARRPVLTAFVVVPIVLGLFIWALPTLLIVNYVLGVVGGVSAFIWYRM